MATYQYPRSAELHEIAAKLLPVLTMDDALFSILPIQEKDNDLVMWDQADDYIGLQNVRGLNGEPGRVDRTGDSRFVMQPGYYGEMTTIDEAELTRRARPGTFADPISIDDLVVKATEQLLHRRINRVRQIGWTLLTTGTFSVSLPDGGVAHTDTYLIQTSSGTNWTSAGAATPLADFRAAQLLSHGYSVVFDASSKAFMNRKTFNYMVANTNAADLYGRRTAGFATPNSKKDISEVLSGEDLPTIEIYDKGYKDNSGTWTNFIPDRKVVIVGKREDGSPLGSYQMTRNVNADKGYGSYTVVVDSAEGQNPVPRKITVHDGHNGGPTIEFPSGIIIMSV